jgi:hypothetical protein
MLELGANNFDESLLAASKCGAKDIVELMLDVGATNFYDAIAAAKNCKHENIVQLIEAYQ